MPTRDELFAAYALGDRSATRVRMNFVESADGATTLDGRSGPLGGETDRAPCRCCGRWRMSSSSAPAPCASRATAGVDVSEPDSRWRVDQGLSPQPQLAVVSGGLRLAPGDAGLR